MKNHDPTLEDRIRKRAYFLWEEEGRPEGRAEFHWHKARRLVEASEPALTADCKPMDEPGASVDEQIDDSFPASDPPSYNAGGRLGAPPQRTSKRAGSS